MHAWLCENPVGVDALQWKERPTPTPGPGEVLIEIAAFLMTDRTSYHALLDRGALQPGETVRVLGFWGEFARREPTANAAMLQTLAPWYLEGHIKPVIDRVLPMTELPQAYARMAQRRVMGKLVLRNTP